MKLFCWLISLTEHQVHLFRDLEKDKSVSLQVIVAENELPIRMKQGWIKPDWSDLNVIKLGGLNRLIHGISIVRDNPKAVHLFGGLWASKIYFLILLYAVLKKRSVGIIVEPYSDTKDGYLNDESIFVGWLYALLRPVFYGIAGRILGTRINFIFAISPKAVKQFKKAGFLEENIFPFGYFVPAPSQQKKDVARHPPNVLRLVFIGALISRKGIQELGKIAEACYKKNLPILFDVYGPGKSTVLSKNLPNLNYCGLISFGKSHEVMREYDLLIVPSKFDGWGVVVNEALQSGLPVLASNKVGAAALIIQSGAGAIFDLNNISALINSLENLAQDKEIIFNWKDKAKKYSSQLTPRIAASYMKKCIGSGIGGKDRPVCPWYSVHDYDTFINKSIKKRVTFFHRKPASNNYSVELAFKAIREAMPTDVVCTVAESRYLSMGLFRRVYNILEAACRQGDINHITGDVHFLSYLLRRDKTLLTILDFVFMQNNSGFKQKILLLLWGVIPLRRVRLISVISEATKIQALQYLKCNPDKIRVVPIPISSIFTRSDKEFNAEKPTLLQVGTTKNKNIERLASALRGISCKLEIIGRLSNGQLDSLRKNNIEYVNSYGLNDIEVLNKYREADLVTFVSTYEGFGMPILEANSVGRPVITGNVYSMPEVAANAACLVDPLNILEIRNGILRIIDDKIYRDKLIMNGFINVKRFEPSAVADQYAQIYRELSL